MNLCIVGTGYVGLVSAACFAEMGNDVCCVDTNPTIVENLRQGKIHIYEPGLDELVKRNVAEGRLRFTTQVSEGMENALFVFITVGTPPREDGSCDLSYVYQVAKDIGANMKDYKIVVDKSTVPVGTADEVRKIVAGELKKRGETIEFDVVSNPEFLKEGDAINDFFKPDRVVVGTDNVRTGELLKALYAPYARSREKVIVMSVRSAEMTKYAANCMLATKISFINEVANICEKVGADVREVRMGIGSDHRIGYQFIYPGLGYGGSCFPKDVKALIDTARRYEFEPQLLASVDDVNKRQKHVLTAKLESYFAPQGGLAGKTLALWGLAFKANTDDVREASAFELIKDVTAQGHARGGLRSGGRSQHPGPLRGQRAAFRGRRPVRGARRRRLPGRGHGMEPVPQSGFHPHQEDAQGPDHLRRPQPLFAAAFGRSRPGPISASAVRRRRSSRDPRDAQERAGDRPLFFRGCRRLPRRLNLTETVVLCMFQLADARPPPQPPAKEHRLEEPAHRQETLDVVVRVRRVHGRHLRRGGRRGAKARRKDHADRSKDASRHFQNLAKQSDAISDLIHQLDGLGG